MLGLFNVVADIALCFTSQHICHVMPRLSARRFWFNLFLVFAVLIVQISLNILFLTPCDKKAQSIYKRATKGNTTDDRLETGDKRKVHINTLDVSNTLPDRNCTQDAAISSELHSLRKENARLFLQLTRFKKLDKIISAQEFSRIKSEASKKGFLKDDTAYNEFTVTSFDSFTHAVIFSANKDGLLDRPARSPLGMRFKENEEVLKFAEDVVNDEHSGKEKIQNRHLFNGITRLNRMNGMEYELLFSSGKPSQYHKVKIRRPFSNIELVENVETVDTSKEIINLILPLSERTENFKLFLKRFGDICVRWDGRVHLTVVYFGENGRKDVKDFLKAFEAKEKFHDYKLIFEDGPFSRGAALQKGVLSWQLGNNIMFFCDVDMFFNADFLERCRLYSEPGQMLYYPIVYSLYNPEIVYNDRVPGIEEQMYIGKNNGFWRDFGFGMTCVYKNDFIETKGFDTTIHGWGTEDLKLYRKFLRTDLAVIRATDRDIFHMYHSKICDSALPSQQYLSCLQSKSVTEGSHRQMGMLAFGNRLFSQQKPDWRTRLEYQPDFSLKESITANEEARNLWRRADEFIIESLEVKHLESRLKYAMNFSLNGRNVLSSNDVDVLHHLQKRLKNIADNAKSSALNIVKNARNHQ